MIKTRNLTKRFGHNLAVDHLSLDIQEGEIFGLVGPNGAGKTTTLRMLACLIAPSEGEAYISGFKIGVQSMAIRRMVGILTESPGLYDKLSARENLSLYANLQEVSNPEKQIERYLRLLGLWERRNELTGSFSKGLRQKLALARALIHEPRVLLLDEPTAALDPKSARTVHDFIAEVRSEGRTVLICSHNLSEIERLCDRVGLLNQSLIAVDRPEDLRRRLFGHKTVVGLRFVNPLIIETLQDLDFVQEVHNEDKKLIISLTDPENQTHIVVQRIVAAGGQIQSVGELQHPLEEVYLSLLGEDGEQS
jgi:ABC-2 type transport system ATP-binding protein